MSRDVLRNVARGAGVAAVLAMSPLAAQATTTIKVAAAANLTVPLTAMIADFKAANPGYDVTAVFDSSGVLEGKINGTCTGCSTPNADNFDLFLAADVDHPQDLIDNYSSLVYTYSSTKQMIHYAIGTLVLYSNTTGVDVSSGLPSGWGTVAIADPPTAPYGHAAEQVLEPIRKEVESAESFMIPCKARDSSRSALPCGQPNTAVRRTVADFAIRVI